MLSSRTAAPCSGVLISCGGPGDMGFIGGSIAERGQIPIANTDRPNLFRTERWGTAGYRLEVVPGRYDVLLYFAETYFEEAGQRVFSATVNGQRQGPIDIFGEVGKDKALVKVWRGVDASRGVVEIVFDPGSQSCVNAIEVTLPRVTSDPPPPPPPPPPPEPGTLPTPEPVPLPEPAPTGGLEPPPHAKAAGFTSLLFHEDFSDPARLSRGPRLGAGQTFCMMGPGNPVWGSSVLPSSAIRHADGTLAIAPNDNNYQGDIISSDSMTGGFHLRGHKWCVEMRWKHRFASLGSGFPAFWSMDADHWYTNRPGPLFLEPDFYELIGGRFYGMMHIHKSGGARPFPAVGVNGGQMPNVEEFFVCGAMAVPGEYSWWVDNRKMGGKWTDWLDQYFPSYVGPLIIGSGPGAWYVIDWVRVWGLPA